MLLAAIPIRGSEPWPGSVAYLDGIQHSEILGYAGSAPLFRAEIAAAVRERQERRLLTVVEDCRVLVLGRPAALAAAGNILEAFQVIPLPEDEPAHPLRDLLNAGAAVDRARGELELVVGDRYRERCDGWLVVDGTLAVSPRWAADERMVAISKSHSILPFEGVDLEQYLRLPWKHRSSVYAPATRSLAPVRAQAVALGRQGSVAWTGAGRSVPRQ